MTKLAGSIATRLLGLAACLGLLPLAATAFPQSWGPMIEVPGVGHEGDGAGTALFDLDGNGRLDMILVAYDNPSGANEFRYRVGRDLDANGIASSWSGWRRVSGLGNRGEGAGVALADLDGNGRPEMVVMAYDAPSGANNFRYRVVRDLSSTGVGTSTGPVISVAGVGAIGDGGDIAIGDIDGNGQLDMVLMAYDDPSGANNFRMRIGRNLNSQGVAASWSDWTRIAGMGAAGEGAGMALADLDGTGSLDLLVMAYDAPSGANSFRYRVAHDLTTDGAVSDWSPRLEVSGVGARGQGAGVAVGDLTNNGRPEVIFMAYDNPSGANSFRYRVGRDFDLNPPLVRLTHAPLHPGLNDMVTFTARAEDADGVRTTNLLVNARLMRTCEADTCTFTGGPYPEDVDGGYDRCAGVATSSARINLATLSKGAQVCVRTSSGRVGALQLRDNIGASPGTMRIAYTVWNGPSGGGAPGLHRRGTANVSQTFAFDMDGNSSAATTSDFWFEAETATRRYLSPRNGARFAVMRNSGVYTRENDTGTVNVGANAYDVAGSRAWTGYRSFGVGSVPGPVVPLLVTGSPSQKLDIVFIRDSDSYSTTRAFLDDLEGVIRDSYLADEAVAQSAHRFNFWYIKTTGKADRVDGDCILTRPSNYNTDASFADSGAIVHADDFRDCAYGGLFSSEPTSLRTFMHETGHALFGLRDIYCCDSYYAQNDPWPNLYASSAACTSDATRQGWPTNRCARLSDGTTTLNFWRADRNDLMGSCNGGYPSCAPGPYNFDQGSRRRVMWRFDGLP